MGSSWLKELVGRWVGDGVAAWEADIFSGAREVCKAVVGAAGMAGMSASRAGPCGGEGVERW